MTVLANGLQMCQDKVQTIQDWPIPNFTKEVQAFLRFANFYYRFICDYSKVAMPYIALTRKNQHFIWIAHADLAFKNLKSKFIQAPVLIHSNFEQPFIVETNASNRAIVAILSQYGNDGYLHLCAFCSSKMSSVEQNYDIYDKKLLIVVLTFQDWRVYLEGSPYHIEIIFDHKKFGVFSHH